MGDLTDNSVEDYIADDSASPEAHYEIDEGLVPVYFDEDAYGDGEEKRVPDCGWGFLEVGIKVKNLPFFPFILTSRLPTAQRRSGTQECPPERPVQRQASRLSSKYYLASCACRLSFNQIRNWRAWKDST